jgi:hypothetical protein
VTGCERYQIVTGRACNLIGAHQHYPDWLNETVIHWTCACDQHGGDFLVAYLIVLMRRMKPPTDGNG